MLSCSKYDQDLFLKAVWLASKHMKRFETRHASIVFANGGPATSGACVPQSDHLGPSSREYLGAVGF